MVSEHGSTLGLDGSCVGHAFLLVAYVFSILVVYMWLMHPRCVGHGGSGVAMEVLTMLLSTCCHDCMIGYVLFFLMYFPFMLSCMMLRVVHAFISYSRVTYWSCFGVIRV